MSLSYSKIVTEANDRCDAYHIAKVVDDLRRGDILIYYHENNIDCRKEIDRELLETDIVNLVDESSEELGIRLNTKKLIGVDSDVFAKDCPPGRLEKRIFCHVMKKIELMESKYFYAPPGMKLEVIPRGIARQCDRIYCAGPAGAGKSWFSSLYARNYLNQFPGYRVCLFSRKEYDPIFDGVVPGLERIPLDRQLVSRIERSNVLNEYSRSLLIFDDFDGVNDETIRTTVQHFKNTMLELGRQYEISCISITHKILSGAKSLKEMQEATHFAVFPRVNAGEVLKLLKGPCHFEKPQIAKILDEEGREQRWMCIIRPDIIITEKYIKIVK